MRLNFLNCLAVTLVYEGGFSATRSDPGNWTGGKVGKGELKGTNMGISAASFPTLDIKGMTRAEASAIYQKKYWDAVDGDDLAAGLDLVTFDYGVNSGPARARKDLEAVGKESKDVTGAIKALCGRRLSFLQGLKVWNTFRPGWSARVANVEAKGVAMNLKATKTPAEAKAALLVEATSAQVKATSQSKAAAGVAAGSAVTVPSVGPLDHPWLLAVAGCALVAVVVAVIIERHKNAARAAAYTEAAANV